MSLTLTKKIIDLYKGKIWVKDRVTRDHTQGVGIHIHLPLVE